MKTSTKSGERQDNPSTLPVIDVSIALNGTGTGTGTGKKMVADAINKAATEHGFFYISGHGIDQALMDRAFAISKAFFEQPLATKESISVNTKQRGWMAQGMSHLQGAKTHDLKEVYFWGADTAEDDPDVLEGKPLVAVNQWPSETFPQLQLELTPYYDAVCHVGRQLMSAIAISLDQSLDFFDACYQKPLARGQLVFYPPSTTKDESEDRFGVAPHTDFGVLTLLLQDNSGGLQVQSRSGNWIDAPPIPGTLVCNIGDLLERWSNNRFTSTVHRVLNKTSTARYSIPVFFDPNTDTIIDPIDLGVSKDDSKFEPVKAGEHIAGRNSKSFQQYK